MPISCSLVLSTLALLLLVSAPSAIPVLAQTGEPKEKSESPADRSKDQQRVRDEFGEAARVLQGPAGQAECVWIGRDTATRHMGVYDRFGCPAGHIQLAFRCVVRQGAIDAKAPESLAARAHACWINPKVSPEPTATISPGGEATK
jgi:hypothetical protein